jgi:hypothetical protein
VGTFPRLTDFLLLWGAWTALSMLAVTALERGATGPTEGVRNLYAAFEAFLRALPALWRAEPMVFDVTPKNETDLGGWNSVRLLRLPIALALLTLVVLTVRWADVLRVALGQPGLLPPLPPLALLVITGFGLLDALIIARFSVRLWFRRQVRQLWRFPVQLPARLDARPVVCLDLHQRGAAFAVDPAAIDPARIGPDGVAIELEVTGVDGVMTTARGRMTPTNLRALADGRIRVGGPIAWDDRDSRLAVIEQCYVVEPYGARRAFLQRRAPRFRMTLPARIGRVRARTVDVSEFGAAFRCRGRANIALGSQHDVVVRLRAGGRAEGRFTVRNVRAERGELRLGGEMEWRSVDWLRADVDARPRRSSGRGWLRLGAAVALVGLGRRRHRRQRLDRRRRPPGHRKIF